MLGKSNSATDCAQNNMQQNEGANTVPINPIPLLFPATTNNNPSEDLQLGPPLLKKRRSLSFSSVPVSVACSLLPEIRSVHRANSEPLLKSTAHKLEGRNKRQTMNTLPYASETPVVYLLDSLRDERKDISNRRQRKTIFTQLLDTALDTVAKSTPTRGTPAAAEGTSIGQQI